MNNGVTRRAVLALGAAMAGGVGVGACGGPVEPTAEGAEQVTAPDPRLPTLTDAYVFGYPLVLMDVTRAAGGPVNQFQHAETLPTPLDTRIARMNLDTLYSKAWLDLRAEPMVLQVPNMGQVGHNTPTSIAPKRYWVMQMMDAWTNTIHNPSSLRPGLRSGSTAYALVGPGWRGTLPAHLTALPMPTATAWLLGRIQLDGQDDIGRVRMLQQQLVLAPLSGWGKHPPPPPGPVVAAKRKPPTLELTPMHDDWGALPPPADHDTAPANVVAAMDGRTFFTRLCTLLTADAAYPADRAAMRRFAAVGLVPGGAMDAVGGTLLDQAADAGKRFITDYTDPRARFVNGWTYAPNLGRYGQDYLLRANVALRGVGADLPEDVLSPTTVGLADIGSVQRRFRLHFPTPPPVSAFWSLTAYNGEGALITNPAGIYSVGHQIPYTANSDGSLDIAVQWADPGPRVKPGNWLPIPPSGEFCLMLRLYAPRSQALNGSWKPPQLLQA